MVIVIMIRVIWYLCLFCRKYVMGCECCVEMLVSRLLIKKVSVFVVVSGVNKFNISSILVMILLLVFI